MSLMNGYCRRTMATLPSVEALSTTIISTLSGPAVRRADSMQSWSKSRVFQLTIMMDTSIMAGFPHFCTKIELTNTLDARAEARGLAAPVEGPWLDGPQIRIVKRGNGQILVRIRCKSIGRTPRKAKATGRQGRKFTRTNVGRTS